VVLAPIAFYLATTNIKKDKENMSRLLAEKGTALIRSFEAGARTGMAGMGWGGPQVQRLLVETARQPDILYLAVTDETGTAMAHSDPERIHTKHPSSSALRSLDESKEVRWHQVESKDGSSVFEVYKSFTPAGSMPCLGSHHLGRVTPRAASGEEDKQPSPRGQDTSADWCTRLWSANADRETPYYVFVGLDMAPLESARMKARHRLVGMSAVVLLIGFAGAVSLFLAQSHRLARQSLARVRAFSSQVVESLPMGLVASDEEGRIAAYNPTAEAILGKPSGKVLRETAAQVLPYEFWQLTNRLKKQVVVIEEELECQVAGYQTLPLRVSAAAVLDEEGSHLGYVFIFSDMTEVHRLQQEVQRSRRLASLGNLAAGVAHEIRNPLSSIKGFATYFGQKFGEDAEDREVAKTMIQEVDRLDRVIGQLQEFARPSGLKIRSVPVADLIRHSLKLVEGDAQAKGGCAKNENRFSAVSYCCGCR
jgi:two-component system sensor histidine kinase HydH